MKDGEWFILFYTCDCEGNLMRLGKTIVVRDGIEHIIDGKIFNPYEEKNLFDIKLPNGEIFKKCLVESIDCGANARAITPKGKVIKLEHKTLLKINIIDEKARKELEKIARKIKFAKNKNERIKTLEYHKKELLTELAKVDTELVKLKKYSNSIT